MDDYILMPKALTAENGAKALLIGEFHEDVELVNPAYTGDGGDDEDEDGESRTLTQRVPVSWTTIKAVYAMAVKYLGTKPADEPVTPDQPAAEPTSPSDLPDLDAVLNHTYLNWDLEECSIRHYLLELSKQCWVKEDGFGGKRPFGNGGWKTDVFAALFDGGFIDGGLDEDGCVEWADEERGDKIIMACFERMQTGSST